MTRLKSIEDAVRMIEVCAIKEGEATENGDNRSGDGSLICYKTLKVYEVC